MKTGLLWDQFFPVNIPSRMILLGVGSGPSLSKIIESPGFPQNVQGEIFACEITRLYHINYTQLIDLDILDRMCWYIFC